MEHKCPECGSERISPPVAVAAPGSPGLLPHLRARVCADCGYTELRTDDPLPLYLAYMRQVGGAGTAAAPGSDREPPAGDTPAANIQCPSCGSVLPAAAISCEVCGWSQEAPAS